MVWPSNSPVLNRVLLSVLPPGNVIVLDNTRFHRLPTTAKLAEPGGFPVMPGKSPAING